MSVLGINRRVRGKTCAFEEMCVCPLTGWNIWNINICKENIYKKQIDKQRLPITPDRNTLDHTGTSFRCLFHKCSAKGVCRNNAAVLIDQGLQRISGKDRSAMFRLGVPSIYRPESPVIRGLAASNF